MNNQVNLQSEDPHQTSQVEIKIQVGLSKILPES